MRRLVVLALLALWASGCSIGPGPKEVMGQYLDAAYKGKYQEAYSLLSSKDRTARSLDAFSKTDGSGNPFMAIIGLRDTYQVTEVMTEGDRARATVEVTSPDIGGALLELFGAIMTKGLGGQPDGKALEKELAEKMQGKNWPTAKRNEYYDLVKEQDGWKVFLNYEGVEESLELKNK